MIMLLLNPAFQGTIVGIVVYVVIKGLYHLLLERAYDKFDNGPTGYNHIRKHG
jgi:hypothetical protein